MKHISNIFVVLLLAFTALIAARAPWPFVDYIFSGVFHGVYVSLMAAAVLAGAALLLAGLKRIGGESKTGEWAGRQWRRALLCLDVLFTLYCFAVFAVALCLDWRLTACAVVSAVSALVARKKLADRGVGTFIRAAVSVACAALMFSVVLLLWTGILVSLLTLLLFALLPVAAGFHPLLAFAAGKGALWDRLRLNRLAMTMYGAAAILMFFTWFPGINSGRDDIGIKSNTGIGSGAGLEFTADGRHIVYLNKSNNSVDLVDRTTLEVIKSLDMPGYPRQMAYDMNRSEFYVAIHSVTEKQLQIISETPFEVAAELDIPPESCTQLNAVAVDTRRDLLYIGCDDTGDIFVIDQETRDVPEWPVPLGPAGKGVVRIDIDNGNARMYVSGCFFGVFLTELHPCCGMPLRHRFTGYLVWETARDPGTRRLFQSVPFRSIVAVIDEEEFRVRDVIRSGLGARALAIDRGGGRLFIGCQISGRVDVLDLDTLERLDTFYLPFPRYFLYSEREKVLYAAGSTGLFKVEI